MPHVFRGWGWRQMGRVLPLKSMCNRTEPSGPELPTKTLLESGAQSSESKLRVTVHGDSAILAALHGKETDLFGTPFTLEQAY
jgi:hypothetical protein